LFYSLSLIFVLNLISLPTNAQCAMCRAALTSNENSTQAAAVNDRFYLMVIPYLLVAGIGYAIYRMKRRNQVSFLKFISIHQRIHLECLLF
jgi:hypothetical protein